MCLAAFRDDSTNISFPGTLLEIVTSCDHVAKHIDDKLKKLTSRRVMTGVRWTMNDQDEINKLRSSLESHKSAMNIAIEMVNM
jgi:hypothetical protein